MSRAPFQVLIIPYRADQSGGWVYLLLRRADAGYWQPVAGGGEDDESRETAARREAWEEAGVPHDARFLPLVASEHIRVTEFKDSTIWGEDVFVIPQFCFGVAVEPDWTPQLSHEHTEYGWFSFSEAHNALRFDGNRTALWELDRRLRGLGPRVGAALERAGQGFLPPEWNTGRLVVRDVRQDDAPALQAFFSPLPSGELQMLVARSLRRSSPEIPGAANEFRLQTAFTRHTGELIGYYYLLHGRPQPEQVWISTFEIAPVLRQQGYGAELASSLSEQLRSLGYAAMQTRVDPNDLPALRFWTRVGFRWIRQVENSGTVILEQLLHTA
jgi:dATP pyrophosphohydrolase